MLFGIILKDHINLRPLHQIQRTKVFNQPRGPILGHAIGAPTNYIAKEEEFLTPAEHHVGFMSLPIHDVQTIQSHYVFTSLDEYCFLARPLRMTIVRPKQRLW